MSILTRTPKDDPPKKELTQEDFDCLQIFQETATPKARGRSIKGYSEIVDNAELAARFERYRKITNDKHPNTLVAAIEEFLELEGYEYNGWEWRKLQPTIQTHN